MAGTAKRAIGRAIGFVTTAARRIAIAREAIALVFSASGQQRPTGAAAAEHRSGHGGQEIREMMRAAS